MLAKLWAQQVISGKKTFEQVPRLLKEEVERLIIEDMLSKSNAQ